MPSSVSFKPGTTVANFTIQITKDRKFEGTEFFTIQLAETRSSKKLQIQIGNPNTAIGQIVDEGEPKIISVYTDIYFPEFY